MPTLLRTAEQDHATRRRSALLIFLSVLCTHLGMLNEAHIFLVCGTVGLRQIMQPSRRCAPLQMLAAHDRL